jgi:hypothetical protein
MPRLEKVQNRLEMRRSTDANWSRRQRLRDRLWRLLFLVGTAFLKEPALVPYPVLKPFVGSSIRTTFRTRFQLRWQPVGLVQVFIRFHLVQQEFSVKPLLTAKTGQAQ